MEQEGVIKFQLEFERRSLAGMDIRLLRAWRDILSSLKLVGQDPRRYGGLGFGNVSVRTADGFLVSGSQTGHLADPDLDAYAEVIGWDFAANRIVSRGLVKPSSESLTHAAVYDLSAEIRYVFHVHSPQIWNRVCSNGASAGVNVDVPNWIPPKKPNVDVPNWKTPKKPNVDVPNWKIPKTDAGVAYGTPAMAREVRRICAGRDIPNAFIMGGHEDGVVSYGTDAAEAGLVLVGLLADALTNL